MIVPLSNLSVAGNLQRKCGEEDREHTIPVVLLSGIYVTSIRIVYLLVRHLASNLQYDTEEAPRESRDDVQCPSRKPVQTKTGGRAGA